MKAQWHFQPQPPGYRDRNPISGEFFSSEAVGNLVSALVREGLQNSLDAKAEDSSEPVRVRIYASGEGGALPSGSAERWSTGLWKHLEARDNGLKTPPTPDSDCRYLCFEDFGTTGLIGETSSDQCDDQPFYCFFRAENTSSKTRGKGGSWGIGKTALPRGSSANAFFALSCRESDSRTVLMGSLTLRTRVVDGTKYTPDAWFGTNPMPSESSAVIQPVEDEDTIQAFARDFRLSRNLSSEIHSRAGTSIVVPWCSDELSMKALLSAVLESNFLSIVSGELVVEIEQGDGGVESSALLNSESISSLAKRELGEKSPIVQLLNLAIWAREHESSERFGVHREAEMKGSVKWADYTLNESDRAMARSRFDSGKPICFRVPVPLRHRSGVVRNSHLDVILIQTADGSSARPVFERGSVVIPDHKIRRVSGTIAIIRSHADELGALLRAAEDPGHKEWSAETDNFFEFKRDFVYAKAYLAFARNAAFECVSLLQERDSQKDFDLLGSTFSIPRPPESDEDVNRAGRSQRTKPTIKPPILDPPQRAPRIARITRLKSGFAIVPAGEGRTPEKIRLRAAFNIRKGNPFKKWHPADFDFERKPIRVECEGGIEIEKCEGNRIVARITSSEYALRVEGFDAARGDVIVDVRPEGVFDESEG